MIQTGRRVIQIVLAILALGVLVFVGFGVPLNIALHVCGPQAMGRIENPDLNDYGASLGWHGTFSTIPRANVGMV